MNGVELGKLLACMARQLTLRTGAKPYYSYSMMDSIRDRALLADFAVDLFDPRPLNRQVLEASGLETHGSSRTVFYWKSDFLVFVESLDKSGFILQGRGDVVLRTIGDFRRFCSLPGIEIEVAVPEDYKP